MDLWKTVGREEAVCEVCSTVGFVNPDHRLNAHHLIGKRNRRLRWHLRNRVWLCPTHHTLGTQSAHGDSPWFLNWCGTYRKEDLDFCNSVKQEIYKATVEKLEAIIENLKNNVRDTY